MAPSRRRKGGRPRKAAAKRSATGTHRLELRTGCDNLRRGHPWIYRDPEVQSLDARTGDTVDVFDARDGSFLGSGLFDAGSSLAIRLFTFSADEPPIDRKLFAGRLEEAVALRERFVDATRTTAFRLVNGEGDRLPGLVVDRYGDHAVIQPYAQAWAAHLEWLARWLADRLRLLGIAHRSRVRRLGGGHAQASDELLAGETIPDELVVMENGLKFLAHTREGQKTGLFLDHRDNREAVARFTAGARVLNAFSYTAGFSVYAAAAGATSTVNVDQARVCATYARRNFELNGLDPDAHAFEVSDAFEYIERGGREDFDVVILDPPSFAHSRKQVFSARKGYLRLISRAAARVRRRGILVCCSCTAQLDAARFFQIVAQATRLAGRDYRVIESRGLPADHPTLPGHPEGRYLKCLIGALL